MSLQFDSKKQLFNFLRFEEPETVNAKYISYKNLPLNDDKPLFVRQLNRLTYSFFEELHDNSNSIGFSNYLKTTKLQLIQIINNYEDGKTEIKSWATIFASENEDMDFEDTLTFFEHIPNSILTEMNYYKLIARITIQADCSKKILQMIDDILLGKDPMFQQNIQPTLTTNTIVQTPVQLPINQDYIKKISFNYTKDQILAFFLLLIESEIIQTIDQNELEKFLLSHFQFSDHQSDVISCSIKENDDENKLCFLAKSVDLIAFWQLMQQAEIIKNIQNKDLARAIAIHFCFIKGKNRITIKHQDSDSYLSKTKDVNRENFKDKKLVHIRKTWQHFSSKKTSYDKKIGSKTNNIILSLIEKLPSEKPSRFKS